MSNRVPRQLSNFSDGARAVAAARMPPPRPTESLQAKLDAARFRLHEIVDPRDEDVVTCGYA